MMNIMMDINALAQCSSVFDSRFMYPGIIV